MLHRTCSIPDCSEPHHARGLCASHYSQARNRGPSVTYQDMHRALDEHKGPARRHCCTDCGVAQAREWSYDYTDPNEVRSDSGTRYSLDLTRYEPLCVSCHRTRDNHERQAELRPAAKELEPQIRHAVAERKAARRHNDIESLKRWDDELDRLTAQLLAS